MRFVSVILLVLEYPSCVLILSRKRILRNDGNGGHHTTREKSCVFALCPHCCCCKLLNNSSSSYPHHQERNMNTSKGNMDPSVCKKEFHLRLVIMLSSNTMSIKNVFSRLSSLIHHLTSSPFSPSSHIDIFLFLISQNQYLFFS